MKAKKRARFLMDEAELKKNNSRRPKHFYSSSKNVIIIDLSNIEESANAFASFFLQIGKDAATNAVNENKALHIPITFLQDGWIVRRMPDGNIEKIQQVKTGGGANKKRKLSKGTILSVK